MVRGKASKEIISEFLSGLIVNYRHAKKLQVLRELLKTNSDFDAVRGSSWFKKALTDARR